LINPSPLVSFLDSGMGGLPYLQWIQNEKPSWKLIYLADNACFPYGSRSSDFLIDRTKVLCGYIIEHYHPDLMVIACNTASVTALDALRQEFSIPFVGVVPAVKPAAESSVHGIIGVLATENTVRGQYLEVLIKQFASNQSVETKAAPDLVSFVEESLYKAEEKDIYQILMPYIDYIDQKKWEAVVLGCTHFILLKPWLRKWLPDRVRIIDSTDGVGRRILSLLSDRKDPEAVAEGIFHVTGKNFNPVIYKTAAENHKMTFIPLEGL